MALNRADELRQHFESVNKFLSTEFDSVQGRELLRHLLGKGPLPAHLPTALTEKGRVIERLLKSKDRRMLRLTYCAINLALLTNHFQNADFSLKRIVTNAIRKGKQKILIDNISFSSFSTERIEAWFDVIKYMPCDALTFQDSNLHALNTKNFRYLCEALFASNLHSLTFRRAGLGGLESANKKIFFQILVGSSLMRLETIGEQFSQFSLEEFKTACSYIQRSNLTHLSFHYIKLEDISPEKHRALFNALVNSHHLLHFEPITLFNQDEKTKIKEAFKRNEVLRAIKVNLSDIHHQFSDVEAGTVRIEEIKSAVRIIEQQLDTARQLVASYANQKHVVRLTEIADKFYLAAARWFEENKVYDMMAECYLSISPQSEHYKLVRAETFELLYTAYYDKQDALPALTAFMKAAPCCWRDNKIIHFSEEDRKMFFGYLCAAAGIKSMKFKPNRHQRALLLKFVLLGHLCLSLPSIALDENKLFVRREVKLQKEFLGLPSINTIKDINELETCTNPSLDDVWQHALKILPSLRGRYDEDYINLFKTVAAYLSHYEEELQRGSRPSPG